MKKIVLLSCMLITLSVLTLAQQKVNLKIAKGDAFTMTTDLKQEITQNVMGQDMVVNMDIVMEMQLTVKEVEEASITFAQVYEKMTMKMTSPMQGLDMTMDSNDPVNELNKPIKSLIGKEITVQVNYKGEVLKVSGLDAIMGDIEGLAATGADVGQFLDEEAIEKNYQSLFPVEYGKGYSNGDKWEIDSSVDGDIAINMKSAYVATDVSKKNFTFDVTTSMSMEGTPNMNGMEMEMDMKGDLLGNGSLNMKTGLISTYTIAGTISGSMSIEANEQMPMDMEIPMSIKQTSITTLK